MSTQGVPIGKPTEVHTRDLRGVARPLFGSTSSAAAESHAAAPRHVPRRPALCADELIARALQKEGRTSFVNRTFFEPLHRLVDSLNEEAQLSAFGRRAARIDILRCLTNLLRLDAVENAEPQIAWRQIQRPIFITGLPRSSTTFLHGVLAQDPGNVVPRCWQLIHPYPFRTPLPFGDWRRRSVALQFATYRLIAPSVAELHPLEADGPQECSDITAHVFHSLRYDGMYHVPSYQDWIVRRDAVDAYRFHKRFLRHLDRQEPGRRWILKSPDHVFALDALRAVYPDALFVFLHRDPLPVLASQLNLTEALRRSFAHSVDLGEMGRSISDAVVETADRLVANRRARGVLHLNYRSVIADPLDAVRRIYAHAGLVFTADASARIGRWVATQKPRCAQSHRRDLSGYGLDAREILARFATYVQAFDVAPERTMRSAA